MQNTLKQQADSIFTPSASAAEALLGSRRSIRRYSQLPVSRELIESLVNELSDDAGP